MRVKRGVPGLLALVSCLMLVSVAVVGAASFDGTYNYAYNLNGPGGWETHQVDNGFIVRNGRITSNPTALSGTVDSSGYAQFTGPSPYGSPSATFTGTIGSNGRGEGTYTDSQGLRGSWSVVRVSGGGGLGGFDVMWIVETMLNILYSFSFIGEAVGFSGTTAVAVGTAAVIFVFVVGVTAITSRGSRKGKSAIMDKRGGEKPTVRYDFSQQRQYGAEGSEASSTAAPSGTQGAPPSTIGVPPPPASPPVGLQVERPGLPDRLDVNGNWRSPFVDLVWERPTFDPSQYELMGYDVIKLNFDGSSTVASRGQAMRYGPDSTGCTAPYQQTYRWNTGGDIEGYRIDALFRDLNPDMPNRIVRVGKTAYAPLS